MTSANSVFPNFLVTTTLSHVPTLQQLQENHNDFFRFSKKNRPFNSFIKCYATFRVKKFWGSDCSCMVYSYTSLSYGLATQSRNIYYNV